jgi:dTDP-4-amino-4,6-dideoxygalactose transaminase
LYNQLLAESEVSLPVETDVAESVWHLYVIRTTKRRELQSKLANHGVATGIHYPVPIHLQPAYRELGYKKGDFPVTEQYAEQILSLPMYAELDPNAITTVCKLLTC